MRRSDLVALTFTVGLLFLLTARVAVVQAKLENKLRSLRKQDLYLFEFTPSQRSRLPWAGSRVPSSQGFIRKLVAGNAPPLRSPDWSYKKSVARAVASSRLRAEYLAARASDEAESAPVNPQTAPSPEFYLTLKIGTPPQTEILALDTGSELSWVECLPCKLCSTDTAFDPTKSSTYSVLSCADCTFTTGAKYFCDNSARCDFNITYAGGSQSLGYVATDKLVTAPAHGESKGVEEPSFVFGCGSFVKDPQSFSILGLDRGVLSLPSQQGVGTFAICLPPSDGEGFIYLGQLPDTGSLQFVQTPMLSNSITSFYYIGVTGLAVGGSLLDIPESAFALQDGSVEGGVIVDCGTTIQVLSSEIYDPLRAALVNGTKGLEPAPTDVEFSAGMGPCFLVTDNSTLKSSVPSFSVHLQGGAVWEIPYSSIVFPVDDPVSIFCYAFTSMPQIPFSIFGNRLQQGFVIEHDTKNSVFSISSYTDCSLAA